MGAYSRGEAWHGSRNPHDIRMAYRETTSWKEWPTLSVRRGAVVFGRGKAGGAAQRVPIENVRSFIRPPLPLGRCKKAFLTKSWVHLRGQPNRKRAHRTPPPPPSRKGKKTRFTGERFGRGFCTTLASTQVVSAHWAFSTSKDQQP